MYMDETITMLAEEYFLAHKQEYIGCVQRLSRIKSIAQKDSEVKPFGQGCRDVLDEALKISREFGFETDNCEYFAGSAYYPANPNTDKVIGLWGHLDVVPEGDDWIYEPYAATYDKEHDCLIGRGVSDNKGPAVMALFLLRFFRDNHIPLNYNYKLIYGTNEETGMWDIPEYLSRRKTPDFSVVPDTLYPVCYCEKGIYEANMTFAPFDGNLIEMTGGVASNVVPNKAYAVLKKEDGLLEKLSALGEGFEVTEEGETVKVLAHGVGGHAASPYQSVSAIHKLAQVMTELDVLTGSAREDVAAIAEASSDFNGVALKMDYKDEKSGETTCVMGMVRTVGGCLVANYNIRYSCGYNSKEMTEKLTAWARAHGAKLEIVMDSEPFYFPEKHPAVTTLTAIFNEESGYERKPYVNGGGTYARKIPNAISFGPCFPKETGQYDFLPEGHGGAHGPDELLDLQQMCKSFKIYANAILAVDKMEF